VDAIQWLKAIKDLDDVVEKKKTDAIPDRAQALKESMAEVNETILNIENRKKLLNRYMKTGLFTIGVTGPIAAYLVEQGFLGVLFGSSVKVIEKIIEPASEILAKLRNPNHVIAIYNIKETLKNSRGS